MMRKKINVSKYTGVGVDIGNFSIKVAAVKTETLSRERILSFGIEFIPKNATLEQRANLIQKALKNAGITSQQVNISVSGPSVICRYIRLPAMHKQELGKALELEWDNYISLKRDEVIWDYMILNTFRDVTGYKQMQVLLVAAKKNFIDERIRLLKAAGLDVQCIDVDSLTLIKAFKFTKDFEQKQPIVLLNIGEYLTNAAVLRKGVCWFSRDIPIGGRDITQILIEKLHLAWQEAEKLKCSFNGQDTKVLPLVRTVLDNLINELNISFEYLKRELEERVESIYISGGSSRLFQLEELLSQNLKVQVKRWNPAEVFKLSPGLSQDAFVRCAPDLAVAVGLALIKKE